MSHRLQVSCGLALFLGWVGACSPHNSLMQKDLNSTMPNSKKSTPFIRSDFTAGELTRLCQAAIKRTESTLNSIANIPANEKDFRNTVLALETSLAELSDEVSPLTFMGYVSTQADLRKEGTACEDEYGQFAVAVFAREDLYKGVISVLPSSREEGRLQSELRKAFEANGLKLNATQRAKVKTNLQAISKLQTEFQANLNNDVASIDFSTAELKGVPETILKDFPKDAQTQLHHVVVNESSYPKIMQYALMDSTRHRLMSVYENRGVKAGNVALLEKTIALRTETGALLEFPTWADYKIHGRMAKDSKTVLEFLNGLKSKLRQRALADLDKLLDYKKSMKPEELGVSAKDLTTLQPWDIALFSTLVKKRDYSLDNELIRQYFPTPKVVAGMFEVYSKILGVEYVEVQDAHPWAENVHLYEIKDGQTHDTLGFFYTDLFPREGKYNHAAAFPLISGRIVKGHYSFPIASIVSNLSPPSDGKPGLLSHSDVETLFHEFGHIMHQTLTRAPYASLAGSAVAQDFVEAPSQMLENWVWNPEILGLISEHYQRPGESLPQDLLKKMLAAKDFNKGYSTLRQLFFGLLDMTYHSQKAKKALNSTQILQSLFKELFELEPLEGGHFQAGFGHLMGGYDAGYYGYLWSEVYSADLFTRFEDKGLLDASVGNAYRRIILESGNMQDAMDLMIQFLGREPNSDAFFKQLGK